jgi:hypothetical protein
MSTGSLLIWPKVVVEAKTLPFIMLYLSFYVDNYFPVHLLRQLAGKGFIRSPMFPGDPLDWWGVHCKAKVFS